MVNRIVLFAIIGAIIAGGSATAFALDPTQAIANPQQATMKADLTKYKFHTIGSSELGDKLVNRLDDKMEKVADINAKNAVDANTVMMFLDSKAIAENKGVMRADAIDWLNKHAKVTMISNDPQDIRALAELIGKTPSENELVAYGYTQYPPNSLCYGGDGKLKACPIDSYLKVINTGKEPLSEAELEDMLSQWLGREVDSD